ncbi:MAG: HDOD domain-containing protein [bacterium]|nr:HDOD domain-containing protein [bacterium]
MNRDIRRRLLAVGDLPTLPAVMQRILKITDDESTSAADLTEILEMDHAISARVLRLANSAFFGLRNRVDSARRAVVVIGFDAVRLLALATSVFDVLSKGSQYALDPVDFWMHSLGTAKAAQLLAEKRGSAQPAEACFTAGLVHDMGKCLLERALKETYREVVAEAQEAERNLSWVEQPRLGTTSGEIGGWIAGRWRFPDMIVDAIRHSDRPEEYSGLYRGEVRIVDLANRLSRLAGFGDGGDCADPRPDPTLVGDLGLTPSDVSGYVDALASFREDTERLLDILAEG